MRRLFFATGAAALLSIAVVAAVAAAGPMGRGNGTQAAERAGNQAGVAADVLGLSQDAIRDLRHDGLSLAEIATRQKVAPQKLIEALVTQWSARIAARLELGALDANEATALRAQLETRATEMVNRTTLGGMQGAAVGAGPANAPGRRNGGTGAGPDAGAFGRGRGAGNGACDGTGRGAAPPSPQP